MTRPDPTNHQAADRAASSYPKEDAMSERSTCPICNQNPRDFRTRNSPSGHWCMRCQCEFDAIDWGAEKATESTTPKALATTKATSLPEGAL